MAGLELVLCLTLADTNYDIDSPCFSELKNNEGLLVCSLNQFDPSVSLPSGATESRFMQLKTEPQITSLMHNQA